MGGFTKAPSAPVFAAPPPVSAPQDTSAADAAQARQDAVARRRRGRAGTILTSERGLPQAEASLAPLAAKKSLLGE